MFEIREDVAPGSHVFTDSRYHPTPLFLRIVRLAKPVIDKRTCNHIGRGPLFRLGHAQRNPMRLQPFPRLIGE